MEERGKNELPKLERLDLKEKRTVDEWCLSHCFGRLQTHASISQQNCVESCVRKVLNSYAFMHEVDSKGGLHRQPLKSTNR